MRSVTGAKPLQVHTAEEYFFEYHQISLARTKLGWVSAE